MKTIYLLYEGDAWLSTSSLVLMGVFEDEYKLNEAAETLIQQHARKNFNSEDWSDEEYDLEQFVYDEACHFAEGLQTVYGEVKIMAKTANMNELGEI